MDIKGECYGKLIGGELFWGVVFEYLKFVILYLVVNCGNGKLY